MLRDYKISVVAFNTEKVLTNDSIKVDTSDYITIPAYSNNGYNKGKRITNKKRLEKLDRAKTKAQTQKLIENYERGIDDGR
jgi:hypothetical protein